jgi:hypothetical protein
LNVELQKTEGELASTSRHIDSLTQTLQNEGRNMPRSQQLEIKGQIEEAKVRKIKLALQCELLRKKVEELTIRSPLDGMVVTWDLRNRLNRRPVKTGNELMKIADPSQDFRLELLMPEHRMGAVTERQNKIAAQWRKQLQTLLKEKLRADRPDATEEELMAAAQEEANQVGDDVLYDRLNALLKENLEAKVRPRLAEIPEGEIHDRLAAVLEESSYEKARKEAVALAADLENPDQRDGLETLPPAPERMEITYILATDPGTERIGYVTEIRRSADVRGDEGNTVLIKVEIDQQDLADAGNLRPGSTVTAKAYCGRRSLGYVLLYDVIAWVRSRIIFRYF